MGIKRIGKSGVNTLGDGIFRLRYPPSLESQVFETNPKLQVLSNEQVEALADALADRAIDPDYWYRLNPELSIDGVGERSSGSDILALEPKEIEKQIGKLRSEGYFQTNPIFSSSTIDKMRICVERLRSQRWPVTFSFVYDQFWHAASVSSLAEIVKGFLGSKYGLGPQLFFTYYVLPRKGAGGWAPHMDCYRDPLSRLTVWIPLSDATVDNSCMYLIPQDRVSSAGLNDFWTRDHVTREELSVLLQATKALPAAAGSLLGWNGEIVHWGSLSSDSAQPRISVGFEFVSAEAKTIAGEQLFDLSRGFSFSQRIWLICKTILMYHAYQPVNFIYKRLAERLKENDKLLIPSA